MPFAAKWMDLEITILSESDKDKYHMISLTCGILKNDINELISKTKTDSQKTIYGYQRGSGGGINQEFWMNRYTLLYIKQITDKGSLCSTENYVQYILITYSGKESEKEYTYIYIHTYTHIQMNHFAVHMKVTQCCKSTILQ